MSTPALSVSPLAAPPRPVAGDAIPSFRRHIRPHGVPGEAVYLVSEKGVAVVNGRLAARLAPLLDGTRTVAQIVAELAPIPSERVTHAIDTLIGKGWACVASSGRSPSALAYWEMNGGDGDQALSNLAATAVRLLSLGDVEGDAVAAGCAGAGIAVRSGGVWSPEDRELLVVLTDDYLHPGLVELNDAALRAGLPWLLAKPVGTIIWVGPLFRPGDTGCWSCLANRLSANRQARTYLEQRLGSGPLRSPRADLPPTVQLAASLIALEAASWVARGEAGPAGVTTIETPLFHQERHVLTRRPQCPSCGDPGMQARHGSAPVVLASRSKAVTADGGHRSRRPEELIERFSSQVSPVSGVVTGLHHVQAGPSGLHLYTAGHNVARRVGDLRRLRHGLRSSSCGKGMSDNQARASAIGEAIERYSGVFQGDEARRTAAYSDLGSDAVHPKDLFLFSPRQYDTRAERNHSQSNFNVTFDPLPDDLPVEWSPVWSLSAGRTRWLPTSALYYGYPHRTGPIFAFADSNGNAAGTSLEDAALQGFFELVERDCVAVWWYNRLQRPAIDLGAFGEPYIEEMVTGYAALGREVWALDLTNDLGVPTVAALSRRVGHPTEDVLFAFGSHFDPKIALLRAITEMNQFLPAVLPPGLGGSGDHSGSDDEMVRWWTTATLANQPYLVPDRTTPPRRPADWPVVSNDDLMADLTHARRIVEGRGLEMLILDQTRPDIGLPVVKVIVPGLRHFWARFAPGRLYDVPVQLGWADAALAEDALNPIPIFI